MAGVDFDRCVDHRFVAAELEGQHEDQQDAGKGDGGDGQQGPAGIAPDVAPGHFDIDTDHRVTGVLFSAH
jgi:hypothetical protein